MMMTILVMIMMRMMMTMANLGENVTEGENPKAGDIVLEVKFISIIVIITISFTLIITVPDIVGFHRCRFVAAS